jgi:ABC-type glycerol-3-phosphate transport system substrate-binding protein
MHNMKGKNPCFFGFFLMLVIITITACGGAEKIEPTVDSSIRIITATPRNTAEPTITPTPQVPVLASDTLQGVLIEFWYFWDPSTPDSIDEIVGQFNLENEYGIEVVTRRFTHPADLDSAMQEAVATQKTPDVVLANPYEYNLWNTVGVLVDMTPYLESPSYGLTAEELNQFYPVALARDLYAAGRLGFPGLLSARVLLYNQTWAQELGYETSPANAAGFTQQACAAHEANGDRTGGWMIDTSPGSAAAWLLAFTGNLEAGSRYAFDDDGVEAAFTFLSNLQVEGCAWQPTSSYPDQAFVDRLGLFYPVSTREIGYVL